VRAAEPVAPGLLEDEPAIADALELALEAGDLVASLVVRDDHRLGTAGRSGRRADLAGEDEREPRDEQSADQDGDRASGEAHDREGGKARLAGSGYRGFGGGRRRRRVRIVGGVICRRREEPAEHPGEGS